LHYFQKVFVPYYSYWSFGENLPVIQRDDELHNPTSISSAYARLASLIEAGLDWKVLEKGVNSAEINSLRSRVSIGEAKSAELEASRAEIEMLEVARSKAKAHSRYAVVAGIIAGILSAVGALAIYQWQAAQMSKTSAERELAVVRRQNADLLAKVNEVTERLANQGTDTQRKLDEIIRQNQTR
jgi:hypothetical protein